MFFLISSKVTGLSRFAGPLVIGGKLFGRLLSKFIVPITALVEGLVGFFKRFNSEQLEDAGLGTKLLGVFLGAIEGVIKGFIAFPLDLIKDGLAWVLGKFGMDDIAEKMKNFSFVEGITKMMDKIKGFFSSIGEKIADFFGGILDFIKGLGPAAKAATKAALSFKNPVSAFN